MSKKYLLSIDGGGIRGIIPALALLKLEQTTGKPARESFSFVAGTSTGALLASAIAAGIPASQIVEIYKNRIRDIFKPGKPWNSMRRYTGGFMAMYQGLADQHHIALLPFLLENVALTPALMQADGLHPNALGEPAILETLWPYLKPLLIKNPHSGSHRWTESG